MSQLINVLKLYFLLIIFPAFYLTLINALQIRPLFNFHRLRNQHYQPFSFHNLVPIEK